MKNLRSGIFLGLIAILAAGCGTDDSPVVDDSAPRLVLDSSVSLEARVGESAEEEKRWPSETMVMPNWR